MDMIARSEMDEAIGTPHDEHDELPPLPEPDPEPEPEPEPDDHEPPKKKAKAAYEEVSGAPRFIVHLEPIERTFERKVRVFVMENRKHGKRRADDTCLLQHFGLHSKGDKVQYRRCDDTWMCKECRGDKGATVVEASHYDMNQKIADPDYESWWEFEPSSFTQVKGGQRVSTISVSQRGAVWNSMTAAVGASSAAHQHFMRSPAHDSPTVTFEGKGTTLKRVCIF